MNIKQMFDTEQSHIKVTFQNIFTTFNQSQLTTNVENSGF